MDWLSELAEETLSLIRKKRKMTIEEMEDSLNISSETANTIVDFLVRFGFAELDGAKRYVRLSEPCRRFFESDD